MPLTFEGQLQIFVKKSFENKEGEHIEFYEAYFVGEDNEGNDQVLKVNTKQDLSVMKGRVGTAHVQVMDGGKMRLVKFLVGGSNRQDE